ncbi:PSP1 domain-containing protein [Desulfoplanes sp.]
MGHVVGVKFRDQGQVYYFDARPYVVKTGDVVLVKTDEGLGLGRVVDRRTSPPAHVAEESLKPIFRLATEDDLKEHGENKNLVKEAFALCRECIVSHRLEMKLVDVEVYFDRSKMVFYFTAPGRIDFRELVKDLVRTYRTRIELRQIGVRHETQMLGAVGNCGQVCCCRRFLRKFEPVTIKMAKDQNLFLNPAKISGVCGRLLCCLAYEKDTYADFQKRVPKMGKTFNTSLGPMKTLRSNLFRDSVIVLTEDRQEREVSLDEWHEIVTGKPVTHHPSPPGKSIHETRRTESAPRKRDTARKPAKREEQGQEGEKAGPSDKPSRSKDRSGKPPRKTKKGQRPAGSGAPGEKKKPTKPKPQAPKKQDKDGKPDSPKKGAGKRRKPSRKRRSRKKPGQKKPTASS